MTRCAGADLCRFICVLLLCISEVTKALHIERFNVPPSVAEGESPELTCDHALDTEEPDRALVVKWWWLPLENAEDRRLIYQRFAGQEPQVLREGIEVQVDDTIKLLTVDPRDSGTYECDVSIIDEDRKSQRLIVYTEGSGPEINTTLIQDDDGRDEAVLVECGASNVSPQPELVISVNDVIYFNDSQSLSPVPDGRYNVTASVLVPMDKFTGDIRCDMNFTQYREVRHLTYFSTLSTVDVMKSLRDALRAETTTMEPAKTTPARKPMRLLKLDIPEMISANQLPDGDLSDAATSIRNTAVLTALVTLLMSLLM